uniref:Uncharacterized protein n=1 Tax=Opuntia streptacantha TaxID=393608 RepID=A0A7C9D5E5_OPUST
MSFCGKFKVWSFNNGINRTCFLTESAIDAFFHVDIISGCSTAAIFSFLSLNSYCLCWENSFTKFTGNAAFLSSWIAPKCMFPTKARAQRAFFKWVIDSNFIFKELFECQG